MDQFLLPIDEIDEGALSAAHKAIIAYCNSIKGDGQWPTRKAFNPMAIGAHLPNIAIYYLSCDEQGALKGFRLRLMGTHLTNLYGELTGKTSEDLMRIPHIQHSVERVLASLRGVLNTGKPMLHRTAFRDGQKDWIEVSGLYVPFSEDGIAISQIIAHGEYRSKATSEL